MAHYMTMDANKEVQLSSYIHGYHVSTALIYMTIMLAQLLYTWLSCQQLMEYHNTFSSHNKYHTELITANEFNNENKVHTKYNPTYSKMLHATCFVKTNIKINFQNADFCISEFLVPKTLFCSNINAALKNSFHVTMLDSKRNNTLALHAFLQRLILQLLYNDNLNT